MVIDYEEDGLTLGMLHEAVQALLDYGHDLRITIYSGHLLKEQLGGNSDEYLAMNTDLWLAQYTSDPPSWPQATYPQWALWQYSENGIIDGIDDAYVDLNDYNGDVDAFLQWISPTGEAPTPLPPHPGRKTIDINIDTPEGDNETPLHCGRLHQADVGWSSSSASYSVR